MSMKETDASMASAAQMAALRTDPTTIFANWLSFLGEPAHAGFARNPQPPRPAPDQRGISIGVFKVG